jgi:hypothetical protein
MNFEGEMVLEDNKSDEWISVESFLHMSQQPHEITLRKTRSMIGYILIYKSKNKIDQDLLILLSIIIEGEEIN